MWTKWKHETLFPAKWKVQDFFLVMKGGVTDLSLCCRLWLVRGDSGLHHAVCRLHHLRHCRHYLLDVDPQQTHLPQSLHPLRSLRRRYLSVADVESVPTQEWPSSFLEIGPPCFKIWRISKNWKRVEYRNIKMWQLVVFSSGVSGRCCRGVRLGLWWRFGEHGPGLELFLR